MARITTNKEKNSANIHNNEIQNISRDTFISHFGAGFSFFNVL